MNIQLTTHAPNVLDTKRRSSGRKGFSAYLITLAVTAPQRILPMRFLRLSHEELQHEHCQLRQH